MSRKRIAHQEPAVPTEGAAAAPARRNAPEDIKARAPRASATAVTHKHKKPAMPETPSASATPEIVPAAISEEAAAAPSAAAPTHDEIARCAYLLWESRGYRAGSQDEDWIAAERMLRERKA